MLKLLLSAFEQKTFEAFEGLETSPKTSHGSWNILL